MKYKFFHMPKKLDRTSYVISVAFIYLFIGIIFGLEKFLSYSFGFNISNSFFSVVIWLLWVGKIICSSARLRDIGVKIHWLIILLLLFSPYLEIKLLGYNIINLVIIIEILLIFFPTKKHQDVSLLQ